MTVAEFENGSSHELVPTVMDPSWFMCRMCGKTFSMQEIYRMLPQDLLIEPECDMSEMFLKGPKQYKKEEPQGCTCGIGSKWLVGHSGWCKLGAK